MSKSSIRERSGWIVWSGVTRGDRPSLQNLGRRQAPLGTRSGACESQLHGGGPVREAEVACFRQGWWRRWQENGWRASNGRAVGNRALWEELLELTAEHDVEFVKVKGHSDDELNSRCDSLAVAARERLKAECLRLPLA
jgi:RNase H